MQYLIKENKHLNVKDGIYHIEVEATCHELNIDVEAHTHVEVIITYAGSDEPFAFTMKVNDNAQVKGVFIHHGDIHMEETFHQLRDAQVEFAHLDLGSSISDIHTVSHLDEEGAGMHLMSSVKTSSKKHYHMLCNHHAAHTSAMLENYAIVDEDGDYYMEANGLIEKGARGASSHQSTRVLTLSSKQKSEVLPILTIDENDVEASHAMSLGQIDEMQAYYLQSRGLTRHEAFALLTIGYITPVKHILDDEELSAIIDKEIEEKAGITNGSI